MGMAKWMVRLAPIAVILSVSCVAEAPTSGDAVSYDESNKIIGGVIDRENVRVIKNSENVKVKPKASPFRIDFSPRPNSTLPPLGAATPKPSAAATTTP